jgi:hypothetical protein
MESMEELLGGHPFFAGVEEARLPGQLRHSGGGQLDLLGLLP